MKTAKPIKVRAFTAEDGHFEFEVTPEEWRAEFPKIADAYSATLKECQYRAALKKAQTLTSNTILSYGFAA